MILFAAFLSARAWTSVVMTNARSMTRRRAASVARRGSAGSAGRRCARRGVAHAVGAALCRTQRVLHAVERIFQGGSLGTAHAVDGSPQSVERVRRVRGRPRRMSLEPLRAPVALSLYVLYQMRF